MAPLITDPVNNNALRSCKDLQGMRELAAGTQGGREDSNNKA